MPPAVARKRGKPPAAVDFLAGRWMEAPNGGVVSARFSIPIEAKSFQKERRVQVLVRDNNVDQALKALKKKMQREGIFREMKLRGHYEKPSEKQAREKAEAVRRARKLARKRPSAKA